MRGSLATGRRSVRPASNQRASRGPRQGLRFLVVEPSEAGFIQTLDMLSGARGANYSVDWVTNVDAARRRITEVRYDFILIDQEAGRVAALDLIRHAANRSRGTHSLLVSEHRDYELASDARLAGAIAYLVRSESGGAALERAIRAASRIDGAHEAPPARPEAVRSFGSRP